MELLEEKLKEQRRKGKKNCYIFLFLKKMKKRCYAFSNRRAKNNIRPPLTARGPDERIYPWSGASIDPNCANFRDADISGTSPVGAFPGDASFYGALDMAGNVLEWVEDDWHESYQNAPSDGSTWIDDPRGSSRVIRGGAWFYSAGFCRAAFRGGGGSGVRAPDLGFRLALLPGQ